MSTPLRRAAMSLAAAAFVGSALVATATPTSGAEATERALTLSKSIDVAATGETLTVGGSGFDSTRGIYLMFCRQVGASGTAEGRPGGADCSSAQAWITNPGAGVPPSGTVAWTGDGTFETTLDVIGAFGTVDCRAAGTVCGVVTRNDHRETGVYDQDTFTPVSFAAEETTTTTTVPTDPEAPSVTVTPTSGLDGAGDTVTVTGSTIPDGQGVYVRFCQKVTGTIGTAAGRPAAGQCDGDGLWVTPNPPPGAPLPTIVDGSFSVELPVVGAFAGDSWIDCMEPASCGVYVRRDHNGGAADFALDSFTALAFDPSSEAPVDPDEPEQPSNDVSVAATPNADLVDGQTITVTGNGFVAGQGVYVQLCATPTGTLGTAAGRATSCYPEQDGVHIVWVTPIASNGTFSTPLTVAESFTDAAGTDVDCTVDGACGVFVRRDHAGGTSDYSQDAFAPIAFGGGDPVVPSTASLSADRTEGLDADGDTITVEGADYRPGDPVFVALCDSSVPNFAACDYDHVEEVTPAAAVASSGRALGDPGSFTVELDVQATFGDTDCAAIDTCAVRTWSVSGSNPDAEASLPVSFVVHGEVVPEATPDTTSDGVDTVTDGTLARTGWSPWLLTTMGAGLVALGSAFVLGNRRRLART
ncbi:MAG: neocarzinostatin apoprotein domain-containing protein [Acidimicrobiales bacterium]